MDTLIKQKTLYDCGLAAIAMAADKDYDTLWTAEDTASLEGKGMENMDEWLEKAGLKRNIDFKQVRIWDSNQEIVKGLLWGRRALLSVKSLNNESGNHAIYWNGEKLFDPATRQTYTYLNSVIIDVVRLLR